MTGVTLLFPENEIWKKRVIHMKTVASSCVFDEMGLPLSLPHNSYMNYILSSTTLNKYCIPFILALAAITITSPCLSLSSPLLFRSLFSVLPSHPQVQDGEVATGR